MFVLYKDVGCIRVHGERAGLLEFFKGDRIFWSNGFRRKDVWIGEERICFLLSFFYLSIFGWHIPEEEIFFIGSRLFFFFDLRSLIRYKQTHVAGTGSIYTCVVARPWILALLLDCRGRKYIANRSELFLYMSVLLNVWCRRVRMAGGLPHGLFDSSRGHGDDGKATRRPEYGISEVVCRVRESEQIPNDRLHCNFNTHKGDRVVQRSYPPIMEVV